MQDQSQFSQLVLHKVDRRVESEESGDDEGKKQSSGIAADLSEHSLKDGEERGEEDPEEGQELPVDMETINLDRDAEVMPPAQPSIRGTAEPSGHQGVLYEASPWLLFQEAHLRHFAAAQPDFSLFQDVDLNHYRIGKIEGFEVLKKVKTLCLRQNLIKCIENLEELQSLRELDLYDNQIKKIENLEALTELEILDISFNLLRNIEGIDKLTRLKKLFLVNNKINKIENISTLHQLQMLELGSNRIRAIENIDTLTNLESLFLGKNKITKLQNLDALTNLTVLSMQSNRLTKIEGLQSLVNLRELYLSHNGIEVIEGLDSNVRQQMNDNLLESWSDLDELKGARNLETVYLERNPLQRDPQYRRKVMLALPTVRQIDATFVSQVDTRWPPTRWEALPSPGLRDVQDEESAVHYLLLGAPGPCSAVGAEDLRLQLPLQELPSQASNWLASPLEQLGVSNILLEEVPDVSPESYSCQFTASKLSSGDLDAFFPSTRKAPHCEQGPALFEILAKTPYGHEKKGLLGIDQLLGQAVFSAALPLHDVNPGAGGAQLGCGGRLRLPPEGPLGGAPRESVGSGPQPAAGAAPVLGPRAPVERVAASGPGAPVPGEKMAARFTWLGQRSLAPAQPSGLNKELCGSGDSFETCLLCHDCPFWLLSSTCALVQARGGQGKPPVSDVTPTAPCPPNPGPRLASTAWRSAEGLRQETPAPHSPMTVLLRVAGQGRALLPQEEPPAPVLAGSVVVMTMVAMVVMCLVSVILYRAILAILVSRSNNTLLAAWSSCIASLMGSILNLVFTLILSKTYVALAHVLTKWAVHKTLTIRVSPVAPDSHLSGAPVIGVDREAMPLPRTRLAHCACRGWRPSRGSASPRCQAFREDEGHRSPAICLAFVIVCEHVVFSTSRVLDLVVPDIPESVEIEVKWECYLAEQALAESEVGTLEPTGLTSFLGPHDHGPPYSVLHSRTVLAAAPGSPSEDDQ
ncbi:hypothetical protein CB1_000575003 [Camelus ferus]|nr:hypothetical protein CB1_000575003 [Camelus ferus]